VAVRTLVLWCPDWPITAAVMTGDVADGPVAILRANRVVAASSQARAEGVRRGMRRREAQSRSPDIDLLVDDPSRDARAFERVVAAIEAFTPLIEIVRPGLCQFATRGPSRYFGGDAVLVDRVLAVVEALGVDVKIGVADGPFAAALAARTARAYLVAPGESLTFTRDHSIRALISSGADRLGDGRSHRRAGRVGLSHPDHLSELVDLLTRLGLKTLGTFAALDRADVLARFGPVGMHAHQLACGDDERALEPTPIPPDLTVTTELDPPVGRVDAAAFVATGLAEELHTRLGHHGLACTRVRIEAVTEGGVELVRLWRHERAGAAGGLTATALADRVRWQLDGWLRAVSMHTDIQRANESEPADDHDQNPGTNAHRALIRITLSPDEVTPDAGRQLGFWGAGANDERAARAFTRLQGLLGPDAVAIAVPSGGRSAGELVQLVAWGDARPTTPAGEQPIWPGQLPAPLPTVVHQPPLPADLRTAEGWPVRVTGRGGVEGEPARLAIATTAMASPTRPLAVTAWAGPWPVEERWWDLQSARRRARLQVVTADGTAHVLSLEGGDWWVEATYE
jgi:protein ImuB